MTTRKNLRMPTRARSLAIEYFPLDAARLRYFGGTSGHWGGRCRPLDDADFEVKPGIDWARWPITKADLDPYLSRASEILEIKAFSPDRPIPESGLKQISFNFSPPVHFGEKYDMRIVCDPDILLVVNANFTSFETNGNAIQAASVVNYRGVTHAIRANRYILATGGIENSRLLLWSNVRSNGQVVKNAGALGKYWMEHPHFTLGDLILFGEFSHELRDHTIFLSPTRVTMREAETLNCGLRLQPRTYSGAERSSPTSPALLLSLHNGRCRDLTSASLARASCARHGSRNLCRKTGLSYPTNWTCWASRARSCIGRKARGIERLFKSQPALLLLTWQPAIRGVFGSLLGYWAKPTTRRRMSWAEITIWEEHAWPRLPTRESWTQTARFSVKKTST